MKIDRIHVHDTGIKSPLNVAVIADLHGRPWQKIADALLSEKPDMIALPGDITEGSPEKSQETLAFLKHLSSIAPTFYSLGNHERLPTTDKLSSFASTGAVLLNNTFVKMNGIAVGGLTSGYLTARCHTDRLHTPKPDIEWLRDFSKSGSHRILLSHHPEYYEPYLRDLPIDIVLSGHAHGGQMRLFGRGIFAPGQGFLPRYTSGVYDGRLIVSRGLSNTVPVPRLWNPTQLILLTVN